MVQYAHPSNRKCGVTATQEKSRMPSALVQLVISVSSVLLTTSAKKAALMHMEVDWSSILHEAFHRSSK